MKVHMLSETVAFRPYDFLIDVSSGPWDYGLPGSARCIDCLSFIISVLLKSLRHELYLSTAKTMFQTF